jgi:CubicO group peptidase (beta-lactamase class C family)
LHLSQGLLDGRRILDPSLVATIHSPVGLICTDPNIYYGLGITIDRRAPERTNVILWQDGQGFGFQSMIHWYPEYGLGAVVMTNKWPHPVTEELAFSLADRLIKEKMVEKRFSCLEPNHGGCIGAWWGWPEHKPTPFQVAWRRYLGTHSLCFSEYSLEWWAYLAVLIRGRDEYTPRIKIAEKDGYLCVTESKFFEKVTGGFRSIDETLQEAKPGVFITKGGGVLDFTRQTPTWCNYRLKQ